MRTIDIGPRWNRILTLWCMVHVPNRSSDGIVEHLVFKCIKEDLLFSRDLINTMSSRIMFTNVSHSIRHLLQILWRVKCFMLCRNCTQFAYIIQCLLSLITSSLFYRHDESRSRWSSRWLWRKRSISCFRMEDFSWTIEHPPFTDNWRTFLGGDVIATNQLAY